MDRFMPTSSTLGYDQLKSAHLKQSLYGCLLHLLDPCTLYPDVPQFKITSSGENRNSIIDYSNLAYRVRMKRLDQTWLADE